MENRSNSARIYAGIWSARLLFMLTLIALVSAVDALAEGQPRESSRADDVKPVVVDDPVIVDVPVAGAEPVVLDEPVFPVSPQKEGVRIWVSSFFAPPTDFGGVDVGLARPEVRIRGRLPVSEVLSLQMTASAGASLYNTKGGGPLFADCPGCPSPGDFYSAALIAEGGYLLNNRSWHLFRSDEQWVGLGAVYGDASWEPGAFAESLTPGGSLGIGYRLPSKLRIALSVQINRALDGSGVRVGPSGYLRWDISSRIRLRTRGLGLQLEYLPTDRLEVFASGSRSGDRFRLNDRRDFSSAATFRDRQVRVGGGLVCKIAHAFRLSAEAGAIVDREISIDTRDDGTIGSTNGDVSPYFAIRAEIRP